MNARHNIDAENGTFTISLKTAAALLAGVGTFICAAACFIWFFVGYLKGIPQTITTEMKEEIQRASMDIKTQLVEVKNNVENVQTNVVEMNTRLKTAAWDRHTGTDAQMAMTQLYMLNQTVMNTDGSLGIKIPDTRKIHFDNTNIP